MNAGRNRYETARCLTAPLALRRLRADGDTFADAGKGAGQPVEFGVLGPLRVVDDGQEVAIQAAKQRTLLACLLLRAGELVTVDELAEAIWGEALPTDPRRVVHTYVTRLRKLLG